MPQALPQIRNQEQNRILSADFQPRYEPNFAWRSLAGSLLALPMLRGAWVGSVDSGGDWYDLSGLGKTLTYNGNPTFNYDGLVPYWDYDGTGDWHSRTDEADLDILGTETYVAAAIRGLTMGGWFWFDNLARAEFLMSKYQAVANRSYFLWHKVGDDLLQFGIFDAADNTDTVDSASAISTSQWYHVVGRYVHGTEISIFVNGVENINNAGIPAALQNSGADFRIGSGTVGGTAYHLDGRASACFLCAAALGDAQILSVFEQQRSAYNI
jgi:hypothetical protein